MASGGTKRSSSREQVPNLPETSVKKKLVRGQQVVNVFVRLPQGEALVAEFEYVSPDEQTVLLRSVSFRAHDVPMRTAITRDEVERVQFDRAKRQAFLALQDEGFEERALVLMAAPSPGAPKSGDSDFPWPQTARSFIEAARRNPRDIYREMQRDKLWRLVSVRTLEARVVECRRRGLVTAHPRRDPTATLCGIEKKLGLTYCQP